MLAKAVQEAGGKPTEQQAADLAKFRGRLVGSARLNAGLVAFTVVMMAAARYLG